MLENATTTRLFRFSSPYLVSAARAADLRREWFSLEEHGDYRISVLDFSGMSVVNPAALRELVVPVGRGIRGGQYGPMVLFIIAPDDSLPGVLEWVEDVAEAQDIPVFVSTSSDLREARPAGTVSPTDTETLRALRALGGQASAAMLARVLDIDANAATNRLTKLWRDGYLYRVTRSRRDGDVFVDPSQVAGQPEVVVGDPLAES